MGAREVPHGSGRICQRHCVGQEECARVQCRLWTAEGCVRVWEGVQGCE